MARYQIWNGADDIYTPSGAHFTADEWRRRYAWINRPGAKMIISGGVINGADALEFESAKAAYIARGAAITENMTDDEVLAAMEEFDNTPVEQGPSVEERTAAALEFLAVNSLPDNL